MSKSEFEHYRAAGELFGRLRARLGFGHLSMHSNEECLITFSWRFNAKGQRYAVDYCFTFEELADQSEEYFIKLAEHVVDQWKSQAKEAMIEFLGSTFLKED
jgi:ribosome-associated toxin RatA of RatAB toxin-antitoxin module